MTDGLDDVLLLVNVFVVGAMLVLCAGKLCWLMRTTGWYVSWQSSLAVVRRFFAAPELSEDSETGYLLKIRLRRFRLRCAHVTSSVFWVLCLAVSVQYAIGDLRSSDSEDSQGLRGVRIVVMLLLAPAALLPDKFLRNERLCALFCALFMLALCWLSLIPRTLEDRPFKTMVSSSAAIACAGLYPHATWSIVPNVSITVCLILSDIFLSIDEAPTHLLILLELVFLLLRLSITFCAVRFIEKNVKWEVEANLDKCKHSAASALLGMTCDASVDMDERFLIKAHSEKFAGLLMHGSGRRLQGESLLSFMPDVEDRDRFQAMLQRINEPGAMEKLPPSTLIVHLRDSIGNRIKCFVYHVPYVSLVGCVNHLIGLREDVDVPSWRMDSFGDSTLVGSQAPGGVLRPDIAKRLEKASRMSTRSSCSSGSGRGRGGFCGLRREAATDEAFERPDVDRSIEVFFTEPGLPVRWAAETVLNDLALERPEPESDVLPRLGSLLPDQGERLASVIARTVEKRRSTGGDANVCLCLGEWELSCSTGGAGPGAEAPERLVRRILWANFFLPLKESNSLPYLALGVTKAPAQQQPRTEGQRPGAALLQRLIGLSQDDAAALDT